MVALRCRQCACDRSERTSSIGGSSSNLQLACRRLVDAVLAIIGDTTYINTRDDHPKQCATSLPAAESPDVRT